MNRSLCHLLGLLVMAWGPVWAGQEARTHQFTLDNGLKVVVKEDRRAPVVITQIWYKVGSADEVSGMTGISHVLEHMMFKGTETYPAGEFSALIARNGGRENAFTSRDYTAYYELLAADRLEVSLKLEADRMTALAMRQEDFDKEIAVVKEERRLRTEDSPNALAYEQLYATAFDNSPYHNPVIGWMEDLQHLSLKDVEAWYRTWYAPNNAILVVVGAVNPAEVLELSRRYFGSIETQPAPTLKPRLEPLQRGPRRILIRAPAEIPYIVFGYKVPRYGKGDQPWEPYALEVLSAILDGGRSSRLARELVRTQEIAASAGASYNLYSRHDGLFLIDGVPALNHSIEQLESALLEEIARLGREPVSETELARIKAQVLADEVYQQDSVSRQANLIGITEAIGLGWPVLDEYLPGIQSVTAEQVMQVARTYLTEDRRTVAVVEPIPLAATVPVRLGQTPHGPAAGHHDG